MYSASDERSLGTSQRVCILSPVDRSVWIEKVPLSLCVQVQKDWLKLLFQFKSCHQRFLFLLLSYYLAIKWAYAEEMENNLFLVEQISIELPKIFRTIISEDFSQQLALSLWLTLSLKLVLLRTGSVTVLGRW